MLDAARRFLALDRSSRRLLLRAMISLTYVDVVLRFDRGRRRLVRGLAPAQGGVGPEELLRARRYAHWIEIASRHHVADAQCLHRSLVLHRWLRLEGLPSTVKIGVRKEGNALKAHAWVELGEHIVTDTPASVAAFTLLSNGVEQVWKHKGKDLIAG